MEPEGAEKVKPESVSLLAHFTPVMIGYTALGAMLFWSRNGRKKLRVYVLSDLFDVFKVDPENPWRHIAEFLLFVIFGVVIGVGAIGPSTIPQALSAGFAWTGVVAKRD
jgi:hypothetical protein